MNEKLLKNIEKVNKYILSSMGDIEAMVFLAFNKKKQPMIVINGNYVLIEKLLKDACFMDDDFKISIENVLEG